MAIDRALNSYKNLMKKRAQAPPEQKSSEEKLDALLNANKQRSDRDQEKNASTGAISRLDAFRNRLREELVPAFEELKQKYDAQGLTLNMEASDFLQGGRKLVIEFRIQTSSVRLEGTVLESGIAFNEIRSHGGVPGAISSGPMLRTRQLTAETFREFVCGRIAMLLRSVLRQKR